MNDEEIIKLGRLNKGFKNERVKHQFGEREKAFYKHWKKENKPVRGLNYGFGTLQDLLMQKDKEHWFSQPYAVVKITPRDRFIVATVIQWLGSNVGWCFLGEVLKSCGYRIVKDTDAR